MKQLVKQRGYSDRRMWAVYMVVAGLGLLVHPWLGDFATLCLVLLLTAAIIIPLHAWDEKRHTYKIETVERNGSYNFAVIRERRKPINNAKREKSNKLRSKSSVRKTLALAHR